MADFVFVGRRHWGCITPTVFSRLQDEAANPDDVDGFEDLRPEDQERIRKAYEDGRSKPTPVGFGLSANQYPTELIRGLVVRQFRRMMCPRARGSQTLTRPTTTMGAPKQRRR